MPGSEGESTWARSWARKRAGVWSVRERGVRGVQAREKDTQDPARTGEQDRACVSSTRALILRRDTGCPHS